MWGPEMPWLCVTSRALKGEESESLQLVLADTTHLELLARNCKPQSRSPKP